MVDLKIGEEVSLQVSDTAVLVIQLPLDPILPTFQKSMFAWIIIFSWIPE